MSTSTCGHVSRKQEEFSGGIDQHPPLTPKRQTLSSLMAIFTSGCSGSYLICGYSACLPAITDIFPFLR